ALIVWFVANGEPLTPEAPASPPNQYRTDAVGATRKPTRLATAALTTVTTAERKSRRTRKNNTNAAGVSLTAAAIPTSTPRGHFGRSTRQSSATSVISTMFTWPNQ